MTYRRSVVFASVVLVASLIGLIVVMISYTPYGRDEQAMPQTATTASRAPVAEPIPELPDAPTSTPIADTAAMRTIAALSEPVKPRICRNSISGWPTYMVVDHCPCVDQRTKLPCADVSGAPIYGEEILMFTPSCEGTKNLPHCNPPLDFVLPNPHAPAHLRVPVKFSGEIKRKGQTYWQYMAGGRVLEEAQPFYVMP